MNNITFLKIPEKCPYCGQPTKVIVSEEKVEKLFCINPNCNTKLINRLENFAGKKGLDIKGISKATFEKLISWGWLENIEDIFLLSKFRNEWIKKPGFGIKSVDKILQSIEEAKYTTLDAFIAAIGIPLIGKTIAKEIIKYYHTWEEFQNNIGGEWSILDGFGPEMEKSLNSFDYSEANRIVKLLTFNFKESNNGNNIKLLNENIVITGKLIHFKNRDELKEKIEQFGGKVSASISKKTTILINNDIESQSSKNKKAKELNIPIYSEEKFIEKFFAK